MKECDNTKIWDIVHLVGFTKNYITMHGPTNVRRLPF